MDSKQRINQSTSGISRRHILTAAGAAAAALSGPALVHAQARKTMTVSVGRQPWAAGNSPVTAYMMNNKTFEKFASESGYDLTVDYRDYPSAAPMVEAFVSGNLHFGMWGNTPIVRLLAQNQPIQLLTVGEGHFRFVLATRKDSPIRNIADLKGKTVGALLGGDPYNVLSQMLRLEMGNPDPKALGINVVNTPTQAQAAAMPTGMDAAIVVHPAFLKAQAELGTVGIMNSFGFTESHYKGPAGEGAGILLPNVKKSPFFPDGYYLHRSFWICSPKMIQSDPRLVTAFIQAQQDAVAALTPMDKGQVSQLALKYWELAPALGAKVVADDVLFTRGWCWPTEGDATALLETSKTMVDGKLIAKPLTWAQVKGGFAEGAASAKAAYDKTGSKPDIAGFQAKDAADLRGLPSWMSDRWVERT